MKFSDLKVGQPFKGPWKAAYAFVKVSDIGAARLGGNGDWFPWSMDFEVEPITVIVLMDADEFGAAWEAITQFVDNSAEPADLETERVELARAAGHPERESNIRIKMEAATRVRDRMDRIVEALAMPVEKTNATRA